MRLKRPYTYAFLAVALVLGTSAVVKNGDKYFEIAKNLEIFTNVYKELNGNYVDELEPNQLIRTGIDAMMNTLDPYTVYYSESQVESYRLSSDNKYIGLGAASEYIDNRVVITEIYQDGPAQEAGVQVGDQIVRVNGKSTIGRTYDEVMQFLRGLTGTTMDITIRRPSDGSTSDVSIQRAEVEIPNVPYYGMVSDHIGYINLTTFTRDAANNIAKGLRSLRKNPELKGVILDLRGNGGGLLAEAIDIIGLFIPQGTPVVSTKGKVKENDQHYSTRRLPVDTEIPVVVLVDKKSASASEVVSGSLQDLDRAVIMGQRTFGKGLVQNHKEVGYNSRIKVTTAKYYIPSGRCIQSREYENGEPKDIADSKRAKFYTKNKRPVLDGGGVAPDVKLEASKQSEIMSTLNKDHWLFHYVNDYVENNAAPDSFEVFSYGDADFDSFLSFLEKENFSWHTKKEIALSKFKKSVKDDPALADQIAAMSETLSQEKVNAISESKDEIIDEIEAELAKRYFFQEGKTRQMLKNDSEVVEAIKLLMDQAKYNKILSGS